MTNTQAFPQSVIIGNGTAVHVGYFLSADRVSGSVCNPFAWERSRVRVVDLPATCPRCAKAIHRTAESASA